MQRIQRLSHLNVVEAGNSMVQNINSAYTNNCSSHVKRLNLYKCVRKIRNFMDDLDKPLHRKHRGLDQDCVSQILLQ